MNLETMRLENGHFELDGKEYVLLQQAYRDNDVFAATAICMQDEEEDGWKPAYRVTWEIIGDDEDESNNANWDEPESVKEIGECNMVDGRIC